MASDLAAQTRLAFQKYFGEPPEWLVKAPGRINLIGDHTDYNGGLALPAPIDRYICLAAGMSGNRQTTVRSHDYQGTFSWDGSSPHPDQSWQKMVAGAFQLHPIPPDSGLNLLIHGNLPAGNGLSSSAALLTGLLTLLDQFHPSGFGPLDICRQAQTIEHEFLGVKTGLLDQMAIVLGQAQQICQLDFRDLSFHYHPFPEVPHQWAVVSSGVDRELAGSGYSTRVRECQAGLELIREQHPEAAHFRELNRGHLDFLRKKNPRYGQRLAHLLSENERVLRFSQAYSRGDLRTCGQLLNESHASLRDDYQSSHPEVDRLQEKLQNWPECLGCRIMGGGFGGSVLVLLNGAPNSPHEFAQFAESLGKGVFFPEISSGIEITPGKINEN